MYEMTKEMIILFSYIVRSGDTIYKLVDQFHSPLSAILSANPGLNPYNLLIGQMIMIPTEAGDPSPNKQNSSSSKISMNELKLRNTLRQLWEEHVFWTRMVIISAAMDLPDLNLVVARLLRNATDMAAALKPLYGEVNAAKFGNLIREHLNITLQLVKAAKENNTQAVQNFEKQWYANADQIAYFLNAINPHILKEEFKNMLYTHLAMTKEEAVSRLTHNYLNDIALFDKIENQAIMMADMMANGIVKQFPNIFY